MILVMKTLVLITLVTLSGVSRAEIPPQTHKPPPLIKQKSPPMLPGISDPSVLLDPDEDPLLVSPKAAQPAPPEIPSAASTETPSSSESNPLMLAEPAPISPTPAPAPLLAGPQLVPLPQTVAAPDGPPAEEPAAVAVEPPPARSAPVEAQDTVVPPPRPPAAVETLSPGRAFPSMNYSAPVMRQLSNTPASPLPPEPLSPEIAIILSSNRFFPSRIRLKEGQPTRLLFTTVNRKPAALVLEHLQIQRWIANDTSMSTPWEVNRELTPNRITELFLELKRGSYSFHDALSGAIGEIVVE